MEIKVLGSGCKKCQLLEKHVHEALKTLGKEATVEHVTDIDKIADYGVMGTPALVVDGNVVVSGRVPSAKKLEQHLQ
ncbi:MAG: thioredoxin family protein [Bacillota bacterium]